VIDLLRRKALRADDLEELGHRCRLFRGLAGPEGAHEVRIAQGSAKGVLAEMRIERARVG
jgi:hypothetical protein